MNQDKYINSRIYRLQCTDYCKKYTGQRVSSFYQRYKEHVRDFKTGSIRSRTNSQFVLPEI